MCLIMRFGLMHFCSVRCRRRRRDVRCDRFLPQPEARKNVRGHMQSVGRIRRDLGVGASGGQPFARKLRFVRGVNQVVCYARIVGMLLEERLENGNRSFAIGGVVDVFIR